MIRGSDDGAIKDEMASMAQADGLRAKRAIDMIRNLDRGDRVVILLWGVRGSKKIVLNPTKEELEGGQ